MTYRYYREFCELNNITEGPDVAYAGADGKLPAAVAHVVPSKGAGSSDRSASAWLR